LRFSKKPSPGRVKTCHLDKPGST